MSIRPLGPDDLPAFYDVRLQGLHEHPYAFATTLQAWLDAPHASHLALLEQSARDESLRLLGWQDDEGLWGLVGLKRELAEGLHHKATLWGLYVRPQARGRGIGAALVRGALAHASARWGVLQVRLVVTTASAHAVRLFLQEGFERFGVEPRARLVQGRFYDQAYMLKVVRERFEEQVGCPRCGDGMTAAQQPLDAGELSGFGREEVFGCSGCGLGLRHITVSKFGLRRVRWEFARGVEAPPQALPDEGLPRRVCPSCDGLLHPAMPLGDLPERALSWSQGELMLAEGTWLERTVEWSCLGCCARFQCTERGASAETLLAGDWFLCRPEGRVALEREPSIVLDC